MIEEELSASIMRLVKNEPIYKKLMDETREKSKSYRENEILREEEKCIEH